MTYINQRNKLIEKYIIDHDVKKGTPNWYHTICAEFDVSYDTVKGVYRRYIERIRVEQEQDSEMLRKLMEVEEPRHNYDTANNIRLNPDISAFPSTHNVIKKQIEEDNIQGTQKIEVSTDKEIKSIEDLVRVCQIDTDKYTITKTKHGTWGSERDRKYSVSVETVLKKVDITSAYDDLIDQFKEAVTSVLPKFMPYNYNESKKILIIPIADLHIGADVQDNAIYNNPYSADEVMDRMHKLINYVHRMYDENGTFEKLYVLNLGDDLDGLDGFTVKRQHKLPQNLNNRGQFDTFIKAFKYLFDSLIEMELADEIEYIVTTQANHSSDFSYMANRGLEIYMNAHFPDVTFKITDKFIDHFFINEDTVYIYTHGKDAEDRKFGLPFHLNEKTSVYINDYIFQHKLTNVPNISFIKADLHQSGEEFGKYFRYKNMPSFFGSSRHSMNNYGSGKPGVDIEVIDTDGTIIGHKLRF